MHLILASRKDEASMSMAGYLLEQVDFSPMEGSPEILLRDGYAFSYIEERHLYLKDFSTLFSPVSGEVDDIIFLSRHSSKADIKSLTVHPTGNFSEAMLGGEPGRLSTSDPTKMSSALRAMGSHYSGGEFSVTFEATHHGPLLDVPNFFIEIGTTEEQWKNREALDTVVSAIFAPDRPPAESFVGAGGGHYMPKVTKYALENGTDIGHMISKHALDSLDEAMILQAVEKTPLCKGFIMDKKGVKSGPKQMLRNIADARNLEIITV